MTEPEETPTPQLTQSQAKRLRQPLIGVVITVAITMLALFAVMGLRPERDVAFTPDVDVEEAAGWTSDVAGYTAIVPDVPEGWTANYARWENRAELGVTAWEVGYSVDEQSFLSFAQTDEPNPAWVNDATRQIGATGEETVDGLTLEVRENDEWKYYVLEAEANTVDGTAIVFGGEATAEQFDIFRRAVTESIDVEVEHVEVETGEDNGGSTG
ncbi:DUF4245 domain-containing protein [Nesterenkonia sp. LB17]|uniref:DUF4245 domain-containing protein n=1 Tax=unclassified Nesterenkonia TaxID=2629769 RepID=UPI001F4CC92E|nr:DUF4245 domain-containing protein [Nesterenkonia sp. LB17]MCH8571663.1 DUF4245 domain-containing protein [Nesterenkonia sp. AY15]